jgi:hypothetical protein
VNRPRPRDLADRAIAHGRRIRRRHRATLVATGAVLVALAAIPFVRQERPAPPPPPSPARAAAPSAVVRPAGPAQWWQAPVRLPGGLIVTGISRTDVGNGRVTINALDRGNVALYPRTGRYTVVRGNYREISVSPTGGYAVIIDERRTHQVGTLKVGTTKVRWTRIRYALAPQWSADGARLLLTEEQGFAVLDVATGRLRRHPVDQATFGCTDYCEYTWLPGDREVAVALTDQMAPRSEDAPHVRRGVGVFSAATGEPVRVVPVKATPVGQGCWSADGRLVLVRPESFDSWTIRIAEVATGRIIGSVPSPAGQRRNSTSPRLVGNDRVLDFSDGDAVLYDLTGRVVERWALPGNLGVRDLSLGPAA